MFEKSNGGEYVYGSVHYITIVCGITLPPYHGIEAALFKVKSCNLSLMWNLGLGTELQLSYPVPDRYRYTHGWSHIVNKVRLRLSPGYSDNYTYTISSGLFTTEYTSNYSKPPLNFNGDLDKHVTLFLVTWATCVNVLVLAVDIFITVYPYFWEFHYREHVYNMQHASCDNEMLLPRVTTKT